MTRGELIALIEAEQVLLNELNEKFEVAEYEYQTAEEEWNDMDYEFRLLTEKRDALEEVRDEKQSAIDDTLMDIEELHAQLAAMRPYLAIMRGNGDADNPASEELQVLTDEQVGVIVEALGLLYNTLMLQSELRGTPRSEAAFSLKATLVGALEL